MKVVPYLAAAAAGAAVYAGGQAFWNRRAKLESAPDSQFAKAGFFSQLLDSTPDLSRIATVGVAAGLVALVAARRLS